MAQGTFPIVERRAGVGIQGIELGMTMAEVRKVFPKDATLGAWKSQAQNPSTGELFVYDLKVADGSRLKVPGDFSHLRLWTFPPAARSAEDATRDRVFAFRGTTNGIVVKTGGPQSPPEAPRIPIKSLVAHYEKLYGPVQSAFNDGHQAIFVFHPGRGGTAWGGNWADLPTASQMMQTPRVCADGVELAVTLFASLINPRPHDRSITRAFHEQQHGAAAVAALQQCGVTIVLQTNYLQLHDQKAGLARDHTIRGADVGVFVKGLQ